jgi:hypothetical protein
VRAFRIGAGDYIASRSTPRELVAQVAKALERRCASWARRRHPALPTPSRPGRAPPGRRRRSRPLPDLDNLKAFNDYYGYAKADGMIRQTGALIRTLVAREGNPGDFIGHIAGDDFVFITTPQRVDQVCRAICTSYARLVPSTTTRSTASGHRGARLLRPDAPVPDHERVDRGLDHAAARPAAFELWRRPGVGGRRGQAAPRPSRLVVRARRGRGRAQKRRE